MRLTHGQYVASVRAGGERLEAVAGRGLDAPAPACPGWTVRDVVEHTATVYLHKVACIREKRAPGPWPPERDDTPSLQYFRAAHDVLLAELTARDPLEFAETWWWDERTVGFWGRRMAHETAIHLVDVELAHGDVSAIDPALAVDGVDEVLRLFLAGDWSDEPVAGPAGATVRVRTGERGWRVVMEPAAVVAQVDKWPDVPVDAVLAGPAEPLYRWLWGRGPDDALTVEGDPAIVALLRDRLRAATQ
ncbi:maleylpyruvate isomerase family mycothiol-dependent enzyme [Jiangella endophytica]|uniref:maleylpyruvate isomerase family mycothiol-dependent enzyme n=1 Tax=Jiangella endophytica TaxID=1623398 RepID=UPI000E344263|nr:maleylpyruvate isomerase family mycothiol-dependent enzyme [Jiangella endophytica]